MELNRPVNSNQLGILINMLLFLLLVFIIILIIFLIKYIRDPCPDNGKMDFLSYLLNFNLSIKACNPEPEEKKFEEREMKDEEEVFHINDQIYTYPESYEKCKAYGAKLASYEQVIDAYNNGAEWTSYGWSKGQKAFYPIQPCSFVKLRREGVNVGPPGVNGGKFNSNIRFGANCYGIKPKGKVAELKSPICEEDGETLICRNNPDSCKILDSDRIDPFTRKKKWSKWD